MVVTEDRNFFFHNLVVNMFSICLQNVTVHMICAIIVLPLCIVRICYVQSGWSLSLRLILKYTQCTMWRHSIHLSRGPDFAMFEYIGQNHKFISIDYLIRHYWIKKETLNYLHIALIFSRQFDVYLFYNCLHLFIYIYTSMFIHETI